MVKVRVRDGGRSHRKPNDYYRDREHLEFHEVELLLEGASWSRYPDRDRLVVLMGFRHGLRASEVAGLNWQNIMLDQKRIFIKRAKGSISGIHFLQDDEVEGLQKVKQGTAEVFLSERGRAFKGTGISTLIRRACERSRLDVKGHAHMLRHSCGFWLAEQGHPTRDIQAYLGHANIQNTVRYTAINPERFRKFKWS